MASETRRIIVASPADKKYLNALKQALAENRNLEPVNILAITAHFLGAVMAFQDEKKHPPEVVTQIINHNMMAGNLNAVEQAFKEMMKPRHG